MDQLLRQLSRKALSGDSEAAWQLYENMCRCNQIVPKEVSYKIPHLNGILEIILVSPSRIQFDTLPEPNELLLQLNFTYTFGSASTPCRWNTKIQEFIIQHPYEMSDYFGGIVKKWLIEHPQEVADALKITQQQVLFDAHLRYQKAEQELNVRKQLILKALSNVLQPERPTISWRLNEFAC